MRSAENLAIHVTVHIQLSLREDKVPLARCDCSAVITALCRGSDVSQEGFGSTEEINEAARNTQRISSASSSLLISQDEENKAAIPGTVYNSLKKHFFLGFLIIVLDLSVGIMNRKDFLYLAVFLGLTAALGSGQMLGKCHITCYFVSIEK